MSDQSFVLDLSKSFELNLEKAGVTEIPVLRTRAAIDKSGSMSMNFARGFAQRAVDLFIAAALKFDDNGELEIGFFNESFDETPVAVLADAGVYMTTKARHIRADGGTRFDPIIEWTLEEDTREGAGSTATEKPGFFGRMFGKKPVTTKIESALPECGQYTGIITDGELSARDKALFEASLTRMNVADSFYQFIGIGSDVDSDYLERVCGQYPNLAFVQIEDPLSFDNDEFYAELCGEKLVAWIDQYNAARSGK
jgi:hypothetical protein